MFVDTLMVTNMTAARGIGNRPGVSNFLSGPLFPYGKRSMALPIWAHARGKLYDTVVMQDGRETWLGFHESLSSGEPYYCRPLRAQEINVDAITCPTRFTSAKGKLDSSTTSYYPPRNDLTTFSNGDCDMIGGVYPGCAASATELRGAERSRCGRGGDAALRRAVHGHVDNPDDASRRRLRAARRGEQGIRQQRRPHPPVVHGSAALRLRAHEQLRPAFGGLPRADSHRHGAGSGRRGHHVADCRIQRLDGRQRRDQRARRDHLDRRSRIGRRAPARDLDRRRHRPGARPGAALRIDDGMHAAAACARHRVRGRGRQGRAHRHVGGRHLQERGVRRRLAPSRATRFATAKATHDGRGVRGSDPRAPGHARRAWLDRDADPDWAQARDPLRGRGARGRHLRADVAARAGRLRDTATPFKQIEGCFVATAAWGSALASQVEALRRARDHARSGNAMAAVAVDLYYRAGPPAAAVLRRSDTARAAVRMLLSPVAGTATLLF